MAASTRRKYRVLLPRIIDWVNDALSMLESCGIPEDIERLWIVSTKERSYVISNWSAAQRINSGPSTPPNVKAPKIGIKVTTFAPTYSAPKATPCSRKSCCNFSQRDGSFSFVRSSPLVVAKARAGDPANARGMEVRLRGDGPLPTATVPVAQVASESSGVPAGPAVVPSPQIRHGSAAQLAEVNLPCRIGAQASEALPAESSDESSGEGFTRKRTAVKTIELGSAPAAGGFRV